MKKGISIWSFAETDLRKCMELAKSAGFDGIELALDEDSMVSMKSTKEDILEVKKMAEEIGLELYSVASGLYWQYNYPSVMAQLENIGYDNWVTAEMLPPYTHYPETILYNTSNSMDKILGRK